MSRIFIRIVFLLLLCIICNNGNFAAMKPDEDGYELWLRYDYSDCANLKAYQRFLKKVYVKGNSAIISSIKKEVQNGLTPLHGKPVDISDTETPDTDLVIAIEENEITKKLGEEGFFIKTKERNGRRYIAVTSFGEAGLLYGTFHFLRLLQTDSSITFLDINETPKLKYRMLNQWDNLDSTIERGYSGISIYKWDELPHILNDRYIDFARANASIGINAIAINNVNADPRILKREYLEKVAAIADIFRTYNIKLFFSANYASPMSPSSTPDRMKKWGGIGNLSTADPFDKDVIEWWKAKTGEIYTLIPDFGGFVVKANSEGMPGPQDYGRSHAEGANMLARILAKYDGIVIWRAFVYGQKEEKDRAKHAFGEFKPLDGEFDKNVFVQVKNGPLDFQAYEPAHPLFGAMPKTSLMAELQITQEYLGHSTYLVYLGDMWREFLSFDTSHNGSTIVSDILEGQDDMTGIAAVSNVGSDINWTGHHFAQANWYLYGRLAWNPRSDTDAIAKQWVRCTWSNKQLIIDRILKMMKGSWQAFGNLQNPYGLIVTTDYQTHYHAAFKQRANKLWHIDRESIGYDRSVAGSNYVSLYQPDNNKLFSDVSLCPEKYLLFFHKLSWNTKLKTGKLLKDDILEKSRSSMDKVREMKKIWVSLKSRIDDRRYFEVLNRIEKQEKDMEIFRIERDSFFKSYFTTNP